ncbi:hypothetical protein KY358_01220 [Candidatus Woesearchaeota archaeon]|nr:hypothetical protein [Candidatus Woesearchaeota archaeon]
MAYVHGHPQNTIKILDTTLSENHEGVGKPVTNRDIAEKIAAISSLPSRYHPSRYDRGPHVMEGTWGNIVNWRMTSEEDQAVEYVESLPDLLFMILSEGKEAFNNMGGLKMSDVVGIYNFRHTGLLAHKAHNLAKGTEGCMQSPEGGELASKYQSLLNNAPDLVALAIGDLPGIYAMAQLSEDKAMLLANTDSYAMVSRDAERGNIPVKEYINRVIGEELLHLIRRGNPTISEEIAVRNYLIDIYSSLAQKTHDQKAKEGYNNMIAALEKDLATVRQRYSKLYSASLSSLISLYLEDPSELECLLTAEAADNGLKESEIAGYVSTALKQIAYAAEKGQNKSSRSERSATYTKYSKQDQQNKSEDPDSGETVESDDEGLEDTGPIEGICECADTDGDTGDADAGGE